MRTADLQAVVAIAIAVLEALLVPRLAWATVIAALYQLGGEKIRETEASGSGQASDL